MRDKFYITNAVIAGRATLVCKLNVDAVLQKLVNVYVLSCATRFVSNSVANPFWQVHSAFYSNEGKLYYFTQR